MADIFISYKRENKKHAALLAEKLEASGFTVWWDHDLLGGDDYDVVISREIAEAKAVIVIWSAASVHSRFVKDEASMALKRNKLVPVTFDNTEPPIGFGMTHTIAFEKDNELNDQEYKKLYNSIKKKTATEGGAHATGAVQPSLPSPPGVNPKKNKAAWYIVGAAVLVVIIFFLVRNSGNNSNAGVSAVPFDSAKAAVGNDAQTNSGITRHIATEEEDVAAIFGNKPLESPLPGDTITHYTIKEVTDTSITLTVDYSYNTRHNNGVILGAWLFRSADGGGYSPTLLASPAGSMDIKIGLSNIKTPFTSEGILVFMSEPRKMPFTYRVFNYQHTWDP